MTCNKEALADIAYSAVMRDIDARQYADEAKQSFSCLLDYVQIVEESSDEATQTLIGLWVIFEGCVRHGMPGGSLSDYAADAIIDAVDNIRITYLDPDGAHALSDCIRWNANDPERFIEQLQNLGWGVQ